MTSNFESRFDVEYDGEIPSRVDERALDRMEVVAHALDESVQIPGTEVSVGIDPILGVVPVAGDLLSAFLSGYIVAEAAYLGVSYTTVVRMIALISIDVIGGSIPIVGTLFDSFWKANKRNIELALDDLAEPRSEDEETATGVTIPVRTD